jgi:hypothetical protein
MKTAEDTVEVDQKSYKMPPREGISIAHFLTVSDIERSARYYEKVFGARILSLGDGNAPAYLQLANIWMILNVGGGPTPDKPTVILSIPDPNHINSFMKLVLGRPSVVDLWHNLRAVTQEIRPDWDLSKPGLREAWNAGDLSRFHGWNKRSREGAAMPAGKK